MGLKYLNKNLIIINKNDIKNLYKPIPSFLFY